MNQSQFRKLIKECICELLNEVDYTPNNHQKTNSSEIKSLVKKYRKIVDAAGSARTVGDRESLNRLLAAQEIIERKLDLIISENVARLIKEDNNVFDKHKLSKEIGKYLTKKLGSRQGNWPSFDDFQTVLSNTKILKLLSKHPLEDAAKMASDMILAVARSQLREQKIKNLKSILQEHFKN